MSNQIYPKFMYSHLWAAGINKTDNFKVVLVTSAYAFSLAHEFLSSIAGSLATSGNLSTVTVTNGVFQADNVHFTSVVGTIAAAIIYKDTGVAATSPLFMYFDTGVNFPINPNGPVDLLWPGDSTVGIFPTGGK